MAEDNIEEYFAEVISNVSHANGVFRVTFAQQEGEGAIRPVTRLLIPANQLGRILNGLNNAAGEIGQKVRQQIAKTGSPAGKPTPGNRAQANKSTAAKAKKKPAKTAGKAAKKKK